MNSSKQMTKQNRNKSNAQPRDTMRTHVREELVVGSGSNPGTSVAQIIIPANSGSSGLQYVLSPLGLAAPTVSNGVYSTVTTANIDPPHLRKLYNMAIDFKRYRVLSGKLIFVPNYGSAIGSGLITLASSYDPQDIDSATVQVAYSSSQSFKTFNLSQVNKEISIPLDVDTSWKKVTNLLAVAGNTNPYTGPSTAIVPVNTVNDIAFTAIGAIIVNAPISSNAVNYGFLAVEYEVEFKGVIDSAINI